MYIKSSLCVRRHKSSRPISIEKVGKSGNNQHFEFGGDMGFSLQQYQTFQRRSWKIQAFCEVNRFSPRLKVCLHVPSPCLSPSSFIIVLMVTARLMGRMRSTPILHVRQTIPNLMVTGTVSVSVHVNTPFLTFVYSLVQFTIVAQVQPSSSFPHPSAPPFF